jgi:hypothetical protein
LADQNKNKYMFLDQIFQTAHSALSFSNDRWTNHNNSRWNKLFDILLLSRRWYVCDIFRENTLCLIFIRVQSFRVCSSQWRTSSNFTLFFKAYSTRRTHRTAQQGFALSWSRVALAKRWINDQMQDWILASRASRMFARRFC